MSGVQLSYSDLTIELVNSNDGVTEAEGELLVHGKPFARLEGDELSVRLPAARIEDLLRRDVVRRHEGDRVLVKDQSLWPEMARESHEFVGEPPVGRRS